MLGLNFGPFVVLRSSAADKRARRKERHRGDTVWDYPAEHPFQVMVIISLVLALLLNIVLFVIPFILAGAGLWMLVTGVREARVRSGRKRS